MSTSEESLPAGWTRSPLGDVLEINYGKALPTKNRQSGDVQVWSSAGHTGQHDQPLTAGPLLVIGRKGAAGNVMVTGDGPVWVIDTAYWAQAPKEHNLTFLALQLEASALRRLDHSTAVPSLSRNDLYALTLALPPREEQDRIVDLIESLSAQVGAGLQAFRRATVAGTTLERSLYQRALSGDLRPAPTIGDTAGEMIRSLGVSAAAHDDRAPEWPPHWQAARLGDLASRVTSGSRDWKQYYGRGTGVFVLTQNVRMRQLDVSDPFFVDPPAEDPARARSAIRQGDLLVTIVGANVGNTAQVRDVLRDHYVCQSLALIRPKEPLMSGFLELFLSAPDGGQRFFEECHYGQGRPHISFADLKRMVVPVPPLAEQEAIVAAFDRQAKAVGELREAFRETAEQAEALRGAILHQGTTGELVPMSTGTSTSQHAVAVGG